MKPLITAGIDRPIWATATAPAAANSVPRLSFGGRSRMGRYAAAVSLMAVKRNHNRKPDVQVS